jgi:transposase
VWPRRPRQPLRELAHRAQYLAGQIARLDDLLKPLVADTAPELVACYGVGRDTAGALLVAAGDNPKRLVSESAFAICAVSRRSRRLRATSPVIAWTAVATARPTMRCGGVVITRMSADPQTRAYVERRTKEGKSKREIIRCLKRYVARELYRHLPTQKLA